MTDAIPVFTIANDWKYQQRSTRGVYDLGVADSSQSGRMRPGAVNRGSSVNARGYVDRGIEYGTAKFIVDGGRCARVKYDDYDRNEIGSPGFSVAC